MKLHHLLVLCPMSYITNITDSIFIPEISHVEERNVVNTLRNSSPGWDEISTGIYKSYIDLYIKPLTFLIIRSISQGIFPDELKTAKVVPIYKSGDKADISNYRLISILTYFSRIFEEIMYNYLVNFINKHTILYNNQFGFRQQYSTNHAIISLVEKNK